MGKMYDSECLECGAPADNVHPEYGADRLCDDCFGGYCDEQISYWISEMVEHIDNTNYQPYTTEWDLSDYTDKILP